MWSPLITALWLSMGIAVAHLCEAAELRPSIGFGMGVFDFRKDRSGEARAEFRVDGLLPVFTPALGVTGNTRGGIYGYGALRLDLRISQLLIFTPFGGMGAYSRGDGHNLGGIFEFTAGCELSRVFVNGSRLGLAFYHVSNAYTHAINPGAESLEITVEVPLRRKRAEE